MLFIDKVYTFLEIGELAYKHEILTSKEGLEILKRRGKQTPSSTSVRLAMKGATKAAVSFSDLLAEAHETAAAFRSEHEALGHPVLDNTSQGLQQLIGQPGSSDEVNFVPGVANEVEIVSGHDKPIGGAPALVDNTEKKNRDGQASHSCPNFRSKSGFRLLCQKWSGKCKSLNFRRF